MSVAQEVMLESTLHITAVTAGQCMELYGPAPAVLANDDPIDEQELLDALPRHLRQQVVAQENSDRKELAACLATPAEPVENNRVVRGSAVQRLLGYNGERTRWVATSVSQPSLPLMQSHPIVPVQHPA